MVQVAKSKKDFELFRGATQRRNPGTVKGEHRKFKSLK
jgi:hypothetical protein